MNILDLLYISIRIGEVGNYSLDKTYCAHGGTINFVNGDVMYAVRRADIIEEYLKKLGYTYIPNAPVHTIDDRDVTDYLMKEGPKGENFRKSTMYNLKGVPEAKEFLEKLEEITDIYDLNHYLQELHLKNPFFEPFARGFEKTEWYKWAVTEYERLKKVEEETGKKIDIKNIGEVAKTTKIEGVKEAYKKLKENKYRDEYFSQKR